LRKGLEKCQENISLCDFYISKINSLYQIDQNRVKIEPLNEEKIIEKIKNLQEFSFQPSRLYTWC